MMMLPPHNEAIMFDATHRSHCLKSPPTRRNDSAKYLTTVQYTTFKQQQLQFGISVDLVDWTHRQWLSPLMTGLKGVFTRPGAIASRTLNGPIVGRVSWN